MDSGFAQWTRLIAAVAILVAAIAWFAFDGSESLAVYLTMIGMALLLVKGDSRGR